MYRIIMVLIILILCSCEKEKKPEPELELQEAYIIGFDPCVRYGSHVMVTSENKDTLVAYVGYVDDSFHIINRLDTIYKFTDCYHTINSDTIYQFPDCYYDNYFFDFRFPDSVRNKYKIYLNYTTVPEEDKLGIPCSSNLDTYLFEKYVRDRQIKINYATKYPVKSVK